MADQFDKSEEFFDALVPRGLLRCCRIGCGRRRWGTGERWVRDPFRLFRHVETVHDYSDGPVVLIECCACGGQVLVHPIAWDVAVNVARPFHV